MLRARFRESFEFPTLLDANVAYRFAFSMDACGVRFLPGHRIRVEVMSSENDLAQPRQHPGNLTNFARQFGHLT